MSTNKWPIRLLMTGFLLSIAAAPPRQEVTPTGTETPIPEVTVEATDAFAPPPWISPTPDETGAIVVVVQPGESLWVIAARASVSLPELLALNNLTESAIINPGDALIISFVTPVVVSPEDATPTATPPPPTPRPTEPHPEAAVCLTAFDDLDQDGIQDPGEPLRAGVAFTIYNTEAVVANYITDGLSEPKCLTGLSPGEYRVTRSIMPGEVLTTAGDWALNLTAGSELYQSFGSFAGAARTAEPTATAATPSPAVPPLSPSPTPGGSALAPRLAGIMALFLGGLLLLGAVLILLFRQSRNRPGVSRQPDDADGERRFRNIDDLE